MNLQTNLSQYINKECVIKASGTKGIIKDYYRRPSGTGGLSVRFVVERQSDFQVVEYEPALLEINLSEPVTETK